MHVHLGVVLLTADVELGAAAGKGLVQLRFLLERRADGVFHLSGPRGGTRYGWTVEMARLLGRPHGHLKPSKVVVQRGARRPANSQLADDKLRALGYSPRTDFSDVARAVLRELDA